MKDGCQTKSIRERIDSQHGVEQKAMRRKICVVLLLFAFSSVSVYSDSSEVLFAHYFDIKTNQPEGSVVFGKIHLKRNKDVDKKPIPLDYKFELHGEKAGVFQIVTEFDAKGRIYGKISVAPGKTTGDIPSNHNYTVILKHGSNQLASQDIVVHVVKKTMWEEIREHYAPKTVSNSRLYGRKKYKIGDLEKVIDELEKNNGRFKFSSMYKMHPSEYKNARALDQDWENVASHIGALGFAYAKSKEFGIPGGKTANRERLKRVIYKSVIQYTNSIPIEGSDLVVEGKPAGAELGDGFSRLSDYHFATHALLTHQWRIIDPLSAPLIQVWPEVLEDMNNNDKEALELYDSVIRFYQMFFSIVPQRRRMNDPAQRWKNISDVNYSEGAWADANIHHRMRTLMTMPILWADYNRPITYVPYWYDDYFDNTEFEGKTFPKGWSPNGVIMDVRSWCDKLSVPSHLYNQSGFHPDGTVTHHCGHGASDVAMWAYGYEWLTTVNEAIEYFQDTPYPLKDEHYQFIADRLNFTYRRMLYKNHLDFAVAGRSFFSNASTFGTNEVAVDIKKILNGKSPTTTIEGEHALNQLGSSLKTGTHRFSGTIPFWNADYLIHRKENEQTNYFFSVKHKSIRTAGAEDFSKVRKSWHAGSGLFQLRVEGNEYSEDVLANMDWHVLPGVTEEWRRDPMPTGPASASMPGGNEFSGILSDGYNGLTGYHHMPIDDYTGANAFKSYHLIGNLGTAIGSSISRKPETEERAEIVTCIDQSKLTGSLTYMINGKMKSIDKNDNANLEFKVDRPAWLHHGKKGYLILPTKRQKLYIKSGTAINVTATDLNITRSTNYIIALGHGKNPALNGQDGYHYVLIADVQASDMERELNKYLEQFNIYTAKGKYHAFRSATNNIHQVVFFKAGKVDFEDGWVESSLPALVMLKDEGQKVRLSFTDPMHSLQHSEVILKTSYKLKEGEYRYDLKGIKSRPGEKVVVKSHGNEGSTITISLPDKLDGSYYDYQEQMWAGAPVVILMEKN